jgi:BirA family biotin operon repressor/biotin-[acetyl-CoA-carboxylase] ligase
MVQPTEIWQFDTAYIGQRVLVFDSLESTNTTAAVLATGAVSSDGLAIIARHQTAGRGQFGRVWLSQPDSSLLLSVILQPPKEMSRPVVLTALAAVAVAEAIYALSGHQACIKWPNDLLVRGRKVCGLLIEQHAGKVVLGVGLNLAQSAKEFAAAGLPEATSLAMLTDHPVMLPSAAEAILRRLDAEYSRLCAGEIIPLEADWKWRMGLLGRQVLLERMDGSTMVGRLFEMGFEGLELEIAQGLFRVVSPETITHIRAL